MGPAEHGVPERGARVSEGPGDAADRVLRHLLAGAAVPAPEGHAVPGAAQHSVSHAKLLAGITPPRAARAPVLWGSRGGRRRCPPGVRPAVAAGGPSCARPGIARPGPGAQSP